MRLVRLAQGVSEARGLLHQVKLRALRLYIKETDEVKLEDEISRIKNARLLRVLWEAGLSTRLQAVVLKQIRVIE